MFTNAELKSLHCKSAYSLRVFVTTIVSLAQNIMEAMLMRLIS